MIRKLKYAMIMAWVFVAVFAAGAVVADDIIIYGGLMYFCGAFVMLALTLSCITIIESEEIENSNAE